MPFGSNRRFFSAAAVPAFVAALALSSSCNREQLTDAPCVSDDQCADGFICEEFVCVPASTKACTNVLDGNPILQPDPYSISFGELDEPSVERQLALHNIGNCTLTIYEANIASGKNSPFKCNFCSASFPIEIFPGRKLQTGISFQALDIGSVTDELKILSDDQEYPELRLPLSAEYLGDPKLVVTPNPVDFGYVAVGRQGTLSVQIRNQGTGIAGITVSDVQLANPMSTDFSLVQPFKGPVTLRPVTPEQRDLITVDVRYTPRASQKHQLTLLVTTNKGVLEVPMLGNAETPPKATYAPMTLSLGDVPLGKTNIKPLTITNEGGAPLTVSWSWGGAMPNTDLFTTPTTTGSINPGAYTEIQVGFTATAVGQVTGLLNFVSNDPGRASFSVPVTANGVLGAGPEVVKVEMKFENGSETSFDNDVRNVDMTLEHPFGYVCNKQNPNPMNWGNYGKPSWLAFAPKEEPERIVLADAMQDGTYRVQLTYMESCSSLPTGLLAGLLGISTSVLVGYFSGGAIPISADQVSKLVAEICLSNSATNATVTVYVNGVVKKEKTVTLNRKGDSKYALDIIRSGGKFDAQ